MIKCLLGLAMAAGVSLAAASAASAAVIYSNDFEGGSTANLTGGAIQTAPNSQKFLGYLSAGATSVLDLTGLGALNNVVISFDLYVLNSMDGDGLHCCGPDYFRFDANSNTLLNKTFAQNAGWQQSYGGAGSAGGTGSDAGLTGALGYSIGYGADQTYHLSFALGNVSGLLAAFFGNSDQGWSDEGFGIDNIQVSGDRIDTPTVPVPAALPLLLTGLAGLGLLARRSAKA